MQRRNFIKNIPAAVASVSILGLTNTTAAAASVSSNPKFANVKDFGALGDGSHDDTASIQTAINSLTNGGGVYFPPGNYVISSGINLIPNLTLVGYGATSVRLSPIIVGLVVFSYLPIVTTMANIEISGIEVDAGSISSISAIYMQLSQNIRIKDVVFSGCSYNIIMDRCRYGSIEGCVSRGSPYNKAGILKLYSSSSTSYIHDFIISNYDVINIGNGISNGQAIIIHRGVGVFVDGFNLNDGHVGGDVHGVGFYGDCQGCKVSNSLVGACRSGIFFGKDIYDTTNTVYPSFTTVTNVDVDQPQVACIWISSGNWLSVIGGNLTSSGANTSAAGVLIQSGTNFNISGLFIHGFSASQGNGILVGGGISGVTVSQCQISQCGTGIGVVSGAGQYLSIMGNQLIDNSIALNYGGLRSNCLVRNNIGAGDIV